MANEEKKQLWRFTFGCGQANAGKCQPIYGTFSSARAKMFELWGAHWAFQYSEEEWEAMKSNPNRFYPLEDELERVEA